MPAGVGPELKWHLVCLILRAPYLVGSGSFSVFFSFVLDLASLFLLLILRDPWLFRPRISVLSVTCQL